MQIKGQIFEFTTPLVMGIINLTKDSFFVDSINFSAQDAEEKINEFVANGADIIDIGAMSTRPNCVEISSAEEWRRLEPILRFINKNFPDKIFSIDTFRAEIAKRAIQDYGIDIINDISGGTFDDKMFETVALCNCPYILMHINGDLQTMHNIYDYQNITTDLIYYFSEKINKLHLLGISDIIIDPGFGFSKSMLNNFMLLRNLHDLHIFDLPILVGISRKRMIWETLDITSEVALNGTTALNMFALTKGAKILRVHDVVEAKQTVDLFLKLNENF
jgi:dihydropteroate synthase